MVLRDQFCAAVSILFGGAGDGVRNAAGYDVWTEHE